MRCSISILVCFIAASMAGSGFPAEAVAGAKDKDPNVTVLDLRQAQDALKATYAKGKRMILPRMALLDGHGELLYGGAGEGAILRRILNKALTDDKPLGTSDITLDAIISETERVDGSQMAAKELPSADYYVVDYWAEWCAPCRELNRDLHSFMAEHPDKKFVWVKIESDPQKIIHD